MLNRLGAGDGDLNQADGNCCLGLGTMQLFLAQGFGGFTMRQSKICSWVTFAVGCQQLRAHGPRAIFSEALKSRA